MAEVQFIVGKIKSDLQEERPEEEIVQAIVSMIEEGSETAGQVVEELGNASHPRIGRILQRLSEISSDKKLRKIIKRSLYRLKSKGIPVEGELSEKESPIFRPLQAEPPRGFGGPLDFLGRRFLMLVVPRLGRGLTVMQGIVGDTEGLVDFSGVEMSRKRFRPFFEEIQKGSPFSLVEMEPSHVGFLFIEAYRLTLDKGKNPPQEYLPLKKEVESIQKEYVKSPAYSFIPENEIEGDGRILARGGDLLKTDLFSAWRVKEEEIQPYADEVWAAEESKLILNQAQKEARFQEIYQRALGCLFPEEKRSLYQRRMEEMAYYLFKSGKEEEAKVSLAVAIDLKKVPNVIRPNPFLFQMVVKSIFGLLTEAYEKKKQEFSLIVKP